MIAIQAMDPAKCWGLVIFRVKSFPRGILRNQINPPYVFIIIVDSTCEHISYKWIKLVYFVCLINNLIMTSNAKPINNSHISNYMRLNMRYVVVTN